MNEYLIKAEDGDFLIVAPEALHPSGYVLETIDGWGDHRVRCGSGEIAFSFEEPGIQMITEGTQSDFDDDRLAEAIRAQVQAATGRSIILIAL